MESLAHVVKVSMPRYLAGLPIPESLSGFLRLSLGDWVSLTPFFGIIAGTTYLSYRAICTNFRDCGAESSGDKKLTKVNYKVKKDSPKVVDSVDIEEIGEKKVFCRCWRSEKFPYCDGAHTKHNEETGDNVGPLVVKK